MKLVRGHGLGNDYLILTAGQALTPALVRAICDRHTGVGADGILEPFDTHEADYGVRIWNPDGSIAEKSGNGLRIFSRWLVREGAAPHHSLWTGSERVVAHVEAAAITIAMGRAVIQGVEALPLADGALEGVVLSVGNPHFVHFCDDPDALPWRALGAAIECHARFPQRTNVQFAQVLSDRTLSLRIWERGAGETQASGSSSCAVAAAAVHTGRCRSGGIELRMPGGTLQVNVSASLDLHLRGPAELVGTFEVDPRWLAAVAP